MRRLRVLWLALLTTALFILTTWMYNRLRAANVPIDASAIFALQLKYFLLGGLAYHGYRYLRDWQVPDRTKIRVSAPMWVVAMILIYSGHKLFGQDSMATQSWFFVGFAVTLPFVFYLTRNWRWDSKVGDYSYPVYLFHFAVNALLVAAFDLGDWQGEVVLLTTVAVCSAFLFTIDRPLQRLRRRIAHRAGALDRRARADQVVGDAPHVGVKVPA